MSTSLRVGSDLQNCRNYSDKDLYQRDHDNNEKKNPSKA